MTAPDDAVTPLAIQLAPIYRDMIPVEQAVEFATPVIRAAFDALVLSLSTALARVAALESVLRGLKHRPDPTDPDAPDRYCDHAAEPCRRCESARSALAGDGK